MNMKGNWDFGGNLRTANLQPFKDYTGYQPMNNPLKLDNPERWQPLEFPIHMGIYTEQQFLTPQMRLVTPFTFQSPGTFSIEDHLRLKAIVSGARNFSYTSSRNPDHLFVSQGHSMSRSM